MIVQANNPTWPLQARSAAPCANPDETAPEDSFSAEPEAGCCEFNQALERHRANSLRQKILTRDGAARDTQTASQAVPAVSGKPFLTAAQLLALLHAISNRLQPLRQGKIDAMLTALLTTPAAGPTVTLECWARLALQLEQLGAQLRAFSGYADCGHTGMQFTLENIRNLALVCRYAWARCAQDELLRLFAAGIAREAVENPARADSRTHRIALQVGTPLPFIGVGGELSYQCLKTIDDEGNFVTSTALSGGLNCKISALFAGAGAKAGATAGSFAYCKTAEDHALYFFKDLVRQNKDLPALSRYISIASAAGMPQAGRDDISGIETVQQDYLRRQRDISDCFSVLLNLSDTPRAWRGSVVRLQAQPRSTVRATVGTVTGALAGADGSVGIAPLQAGLSVGLLTKTTRTKRMQTLCELLKNDCVSDRFREEMLDRIDQASSAARKKVSAFWSDQCNTARDGLLVRRVHCLEQDFSHYLRLYARHASGQKGTQASLDAFNRQYDATNTLDCLRIMALLVAHFYGQAQLLNAGPGKDQLTERLLALENSLHQCVIPGARAYLELHACATQPVEYASNEQTVQFSVGPDLSNAGVKITSRSVQHYNPWRDGDYVTVEFPIGPDPVKNRCALRSIADYFARGSTGLQSFFENSDWGRNGTVILRFFKPAQFAGMPYIKLYERRTVQRSRQIGAEIPVPLGGVVNLKVGWSYSETDNQFISENPGTDSLLYFALHYMHALSCGKTTRSGQIVQDSYWHRMEREQPAALEKLFVQYARINSGVRTELLAIEQAMLRNAAEVNQCQAARAAFYVLAERLAGSGGRDNYLAALQGFKKLLDAYYPYWQRQKENATACKKWQYRLH